jgi:hypothetical protein
VHQLLAARHGGAQAGGVRHVTGDDSEVLRRTRQRLLAESAWAAAVGA